MELDKLIRKLTDDKKTTLTAMLLEDRTAEDEEFQPLGYPSECVHCGHETTVRNVSIRGKPRFKCKDCKWTFSHDAFKLRFGSGKSKTHWKRYLELMFDEFSLRKIEKRMVSSGLPICFDTAFTWRHKVLTALRMAIRTNLAGIVEADETYFRLSFKGRRKSLEHRPYKRTMPSSKRVVNKNLVCVATGADRNDTTYLKPVCLGRMRIVDFVDNLAEHIDWDNTTFLTDGHKSYVPQEDAFNFTHVRIDGHGGGAYCINTVNSCHSHFKGFLKRFHGVATKYLDNYLAFWQWLKLDFTPAIPDTRGWIKGKALQNMEMTLQ